MKFNIKEHLIFSDESGWDSGNRYASLAMISGSYNNTLELNKHLKNILASYKKKEIKFKSIKNNKDREIASTFLGCSIDYLRSNKIKVHVLVWDKQDQRHNILGRCDITNLKMMYYKILKVVLNHWRHIDATWSFYPDEFTAIDWENDIYKYIRNTRIGKPPIHPELFKTFERVKFPKCHITQELDSKELPVLQLADIYAGMIRTSRSETETFIPWYNNKRKENQLSLFDIKENVQVSSSIIPKFDVMYDFKCKADNFKMGINIKEKGYFKTFTKKNNIFIWHYEPQGEFDKAPVKKK